MRNFVYPMVTLCLCVSPAPTYAQVAYQDPSQGLVRTFTQHTNTVTSVAFLPDGLRFLSGSRDGTLRLWEAATGRELRVFAFAEVERLPGLLQRPRVSSAAISHDGSR